VVKGWLMCLQSVVCLSVLPQGTPALVWGPTSRVSDQKLMSPDIHPTCIA
jgi:hypothetical protein